MHTFSFFSLGACHCYPGWTGSNCTKVCPPGTYGINCGLPCKCLNGGSCRAIDGVCHCKPGFTGPACSEGQYILLFQFEFNTWRNTYLFSMLLLSLNIKIWQIIYDFTVCPDQYYGDHCMSICNCPSEKFICHAVDGCVCRHGYTGTSRTLYLSAHNKSTIHI